VKPQSGDSAAAAERAKDVARWVLSGAYDPLLACRDLAGLRAELPAVADEIIDTFVGVASEVDDLPIGSEREQWSAEALKAKDAEAADYRERVRGAVEEALRGLLAALGGRH
jgi:hypothetical protein